ncbi:VPS35 endosomal protein-sorting factor-like isoform X2 [Artemia franciscana]|uniref:Uncharacterized protein n=1 Tax=Artemia franciscana TaxID=6661 RepID=A0AA88L351_ARTSF|nr:hypothetical protein QYM36_009159 [Artemia franciscana]
MYHASPNILNEALEGLDPLSALLLDSSHADLEFSAPTSIAHQWDEIMHQTVAVFKLQIESFPEQKTMREKATLNLTHSLPALPYPLVYSSVCDLLEAFGDLVYNRVICKAGGKSTGQQKENFVSKEASETSKNWLCKISQIPDLVCKLYVEIALIRVHSFAKIEKPEQTLARIFLCICEVTDPVIYIYMLAYLLKSVNNHMHGKVSSSWYEDVWQTTLLNVSEGLPKLQKIPEYEKIQNSVVAGLELLLFGLNWALGSSFWTLENIQKCVSSSQSGVLVHALVKAMPVGYCSEHALYLTEAISGIKGYPIDKIYIALGNKLAQSGVQKSQRRKVLSLAWRGISYSLDIKKFVQVSEAWIAYVIKYHNTKDLDVIIGEIIGGLKSRLQLTKKPLATSEINVLLSLLTKMLHETENFWTLLSLDNFLSFLEMFPKPYARFTASKECLVKAISQKGDIPLFFLLPVLEICRFTYNSLTSTSPEDDKKQVSNLVCGVIKKISTHWDVDAQLDTYVDLRRDFSELEDVLVLLIERCCQLTSETAERKTSTDKSDSFFTTCTAFIFITIPSIRNPKKRLQLYIKSGDSSIKASCYGTAEASLTEAVKLLVPHELLRKEVQEMEWVSFAVELSETILLLPDHPDRGPLFLLSNLCTIVSQQHFNSPEVHLKWLLHMYPLICRILSFEQGIPRHFVELYSGNIDFQLKAKDVKNLLLEEIAELLKNLEDSSNYKSQVLFATNLARSVLMPGISTDQETLKLLLHLIKILVKCSAPQCEVNEIVASLKELLIGSNCEKFIAKIESLVR